MAGGAGSGIGVGHGGIDAVSGMRIVSIDARTREDFEAWKVQHRLHQ